MTSTRPTSLSVESNYNGMLSKYSLEENIARGSQGSVYRATDLETGDPVAIKLEQVMDYGIWDDRKCEQIQREVFCLTILSHPNIVQFRTCANVTHGKGNKHMWVVTECLECDLQDYINSFRQKSELVPLVQVKKFMYMILKALCFTHNANIVHGNVKPENILVDSNQNIVKLADFGSANYGRGKFPSCSAVLGTLCYRAPEILYGHPHYRSGVDIWSAGAVFAELAGGRVLFQKASNRTEEIYAIARLFGSQEDSNQIDPRIRDELPSFPHREDVNPRRRLSPYILRIGKYGVDLLLAMLDVDAGARITAREALESKYFDDVRNQY